MLPEWLWWRGRLFHLLCGWRRFWHSRWSGRLARQWHKPCRFHHHPPGYIWHSYFTLLSRAAWICSATELGCIITLIYATLWALFLFCRVFQDFHATCVRLLGGEICRSCWGTRAWFHQWFWQQGRWAEPGWCILRSKNFRGWCQNGMSEWMGKPNLSSEAYSSVSVQCPAWRFPRIPRNISHRKCSCPRSCQPRGRNKIIQHVCKKRRPNHQGLSWCDWEKWLKGVITPQDSPPDESAGHASSMKNLTPQGALTAAHTGTRLPGSTTACVMRLDRTTNKLSAANLVRAKLNWLYPHLAWHSNSHRSTQSLLVRPSQKREITKGFTWCKMEGLTRGSPVGQEGRRAWKATWVSSCLILAWHPTL